MSDEDSGASADVREQVDFLAAGTDFGDEGLAQAMRAELAERLREGRPLRVYLGVDPTSPNIHVGHGVVLNLLARFQELGHHVTFLIGDFTAGIGDPTGRSQTRPPLTGDEIRANAQTYAEQAFHVLDRDRTALRYNSEWLAELAPGDMIQLAASMTLAQVLAREDFRNRFEGGTPIHLHEFLYALLQGEDACRLETDVQVGGRDQLFNILAGRDVMKARGLRPQVVLTMPILPGTDGKLKMSKSYGNDIGITIDPADMYGKVMSVPDEAMADYFRLASGLEPAAAEARLADLAAGRLHPRDAKMLLARTIVKLWHDEAAADAAQEAFVTQFQRHEVPADVTELPVPEEATTALDLVMATGVAKSRSEARRLIQGGGVAVDDLKLAAWDAPLPDELDGRILRVGKRRLFRLRRAATA